MRTLHLTSPLMHGSDVRELQGILRSFGYFKGEADGQYGPLTAQAVYRAKYRLGYVKPDQYAGELLLAILTKKVKQGPVQKALAKKRALADKRKKNSAMPREHRIIHTALQQLGQTEHPPGSNISLYSRWYGVTGAWCAMFVTWVHVTLGYSFKTFKRGSRYAYVPYIVADAVAGRNGLMLTHGPFDAVIACYDWNKDKVADHTGICATEATLRKVAPVLLAQAIRRFGPLSLNDFWCIEGNTSVGNDSNGGNVELRKRNRSLVQAFVKVAA